jgi:transposase-like protein
MTTTRKQHSPQFKARVVIEAIRGQKTLSQLGSRFKVHPIQIAKWRKAALEQMHAAHSGLAVRASDDRLKCFVFSIV